MCLRWQILKTCHFIAEVTFNQKNAKNERTIRKQSVRWEAQRFIWKVYQNLIIFDHTFCQVVWYVISALTDLKVRTEKFVQYIDSQSSCLVFTHYTLFLQATSLLATSPWNIICKATFMAESSSINNIIKFQIFQSVLRMFSCFLLISE